MKKLTNAIGFRFTGILLFLLAIVGLVATTTLSISGGANDYTNINKLFEGLKDYQGVFKLSGFVIGTIFIQLMIFAVSSIETFIKHKFNRHYLKALFLQYGLLIVSIYYNFRFFGANSLIKLLLCILLDLSVIKLVSLAMDLITLNYTLANDKNEINDIGIFKLAIYNFTARFKVKMMKQYQINRALLEQSQHIKNESENIIIESENKVNTSQHIENTRDNILYLEDHSTSKNIDEYIESMEEGQKINVKIVRTIFNLTAREWEKIRDNNTLLVVKNGFTYRK